MLEAGFWDQQELVQRTTREMSALKKTLEEWKHLSGLYEDAGTLLELWEETGDKTLRDELSSALPKLERAVDELEFTSLLSGEYDGNNAILTIHPPGAGGTESQDWASMLWRMYSRWAEKESTKWKF